MKHYDCIVIGFGTGGSTAAIYAAEYGASVLVLERGTVPGGTHTGGGIGSYYSQNLCHPLTELDDFDDEVGEKDFLPGLSERKKHRLENFARKNGAEIHYQAFPVEAIKKDGGVAGVRWLEAGQIYEASAHVVIDGTAEGFFCRLAGCPMRSGRSSDGIFQPFTNTMLRLYPGEQVFADTFDSGRIDPYDSEEYSKTLLETMSYHRKEDYAADPFMVCPAELPGVREGAHVIPPGGLYTLKEFFSRVPVPEPLFFTCSNIDTHGNDIALESDLFQEWMILASMWGVNLGFPIPMRTIFPEGVPGILIASRCLGIDHDLGHAVRMNGAMIRLGRAVGILAALSAKKNIPPEKIPYSELKPHLLLEPELILENSSVYDLSAEEVFDLLNSSAPGKGLWSVRWSGTPDDAELIRRMNHAPERSELRRHTAFALALRRNPAALEELYSMVRERDPYSPATGRKNNHPRGYSAVCALGLLRDANAVGLLTDILGEANPGGKRYEYHTYAVTALLRIGDAHSETRTEIAAQLRLRAEDPDWILEARLKGTAKTFKRMDALFRSVISRKLDSWGIPNRIPETLSGMRLDSFERCQVQKKKGEAVWE